MPLIDRQALNFAETVDQNFAFLLAHGFRRVQREPTIVRFKSRNLFVNVYHGRQSYEIELEIGPHGSGNETSYSMSDIIRLVEPRRADEYRRYVAYIAEGVSKGVQRLAALFRHYFDAGVFDDGKIFERLQDSREAAVHSYWKEMALTQVRQQLDAAWHGKNYAKIIELLEPLTSELTSTELSKLKYAKKKIAQ